MTGIILYELPYKDTTTQNYIYEIPRITNALKDQERVVIQINQESQGNEIWIPLEYVQPRLEGNMVRRKNGEMIEDIAIQL
ncbi:hypothetical protein KKG31_07310 [Patescibacteria group bacterium]|nr:hypothetical protein [Patescibacteria group bacterium]MBU1758885.1 hypothetical protein [Patescibacteria group bacterium]